MRPTDHEQTTNWRSLVVSDGQGGQFGRGSGPGKACKHRVIAKRSLSFTWQRPLVRTQYRPLDVSPGQRLISGGAAQANGRSERHQGSAQTTDRPQTGVRLRGLPAGRASFRRDGLRFESISVHSCCRTDDVPAGIGARRTCDWSPAEFRQVEPWPDPVGSEFVAEFVLSI
jgi:hypothetical protein